ncbi:XTP/dITP diphosphatase [Effusibacillus dendaii]|uniref:dITP/XTP pyrophosphatase n=1 Tax=Effusibacillus dendaii TaxID=2743772 RepID=A0A7I8DEG2_9BACL|nr:XTP/dITP diphosphatase [Effusibacillus dendaii]BCJ88514.1 non-canonical purine NTP pyrophosphatase [Effusibacillus dendaii]
MKLVLASRNKGKLREFQEALVKFGYTVEPMPENLPEVVEDGLTFEENAAKKAESVAAWLNVPVLADDSGLEVDAIGGRPGVFSARYSGLHATDQENNSKLLKELSGIAKDRRTARFVCVLAFARPGENTILARGECEGLILEAPQGDAGFGYDPLFLVPQFGKTFGELSLSEKNQVSHRANAIRMLTEQMHP